MSHFHFDGTPAAYAYSPGFGDGYDNWHVYLQGGAWCWNVTECLDRSNSTPGSSAKLMSSAHGVVSFGGMLEANSSFNPDFYNWHVVKIFYCDGSSFMSDVEDVDPKHNLTYRGARIYDAVMDELLRIGMRNATNALRQVD
ncbi:pectin acetylesterase 11-like [Salvia hispanica]|uniref:pectin acetylesterase 11-like n=1 Tax=Salvia hispanica TaxID=49212 RepID=UPI002009D3F2|nr:pectin acetylesterase 11-like [Salvia hispanica]